MEKKKLFAAAAMSLAILMSVSLSGCGESKNNDNSVVESSDTSEEKEPTTYGTIEWPSDGLGSFIPVPISKTGEIMWDSSDSFLAVIAKTSKSDFSKYINKCKDKGFSIDCLEDDTGYMAKNRDGYKVTLIFEDDNTMNVSVYAPDDESSNKESSKKEQSSKKQESKKEESSKKESSKEEKSDSDTVTPSFKEMMDEYEEFMNKYVDFMKSYDANDVTMLSEYTELLSQYNTYMDKVSKIDEDELSSADLAYYLDVTNRVNKKLLEVQQ